MKVEVKKKIAERLKEKVEGDDDFKDVEEYVNYILAQVVERLEKENREFGQEDEEKVKERLRALGYID